MQKPVYHVMRLLCQVVADCPVGTNLGLLHILWALVSGKLLSSRGSIFAALEACDLTPPAVRRAWVALHGGSWTANSLVEVWG